MRQVEARARYSGSTTAKWSSGSIVGDGGKNFCLGFSAAQAQVRALSADVSVENDKRSVIASPPIGPKRWEHDRRRTSRRAPERVLRHGDSKLTYGTQSTKK